jgi:hypothetical protein
MIWEDAGISDLTDKHLDKWPLLLPERVQLSPTVQAVSLGNSYELSTEGKRMQHCVGGYSNRCFLGECHIISLRDSYDRSLSTLEISADKYYDRSLKIIQHKAHGNRTPAPFLITLESNLLSAIHQHADFKALAERRKKIAKIHKLSNLSFGLMGRDFEQTDVDQVSAAMGQDRLMRLFQSDVRP